MSVTFEDYNNVCVVAVGGSFQDREAKELSVGLKDRFSRFATTDVVLDLQNVEFIDSTGLEAMVQAARRCQERSGRLKLARLTPQCRKILEITRLNVRFESHDDLAEAMKAMA